VPLPDETSAATREAWSHHDEERRLSLPIAEEDVGRLLPMRVVVDSIEQAERESKDPFGSIERGQLSWSAIAGLRLLVAGSVGRRRRQKVMLLESHGLGSMASWAPLGHTRPRELDDGGERSRSGIPRRMRRWRRRPGSRRF
jgi:hypothetical protein